MSPSRILIAAGPRAVEELVLARIEEEMREARRDFTLLARPSRIVVPSLSLRDHLAAALVRRLGAVAGCQVVTVAGLARELLERAGEPTAMTGTVLFEVLVRRLARHRPALAEGLGGLDGGWAVVAGVVRDLIDSGLESAHAAALDEYLATASPRAATRAQLGRARAVVETALAMQLALRELGLARGSTLYADAREALESRGPSLLPTRQLLVHGFADATGVVTDLIESLLRILGGTVFLDQPVGVGQEDPGSRVSHGARFRARLSQVAAVEKVSSAEPPHTPPVVDRFAAADLEAELREVAQRIRQKIERGAIPETIGVVARDLEPHGLALRRHFRALGVPFSALGARGPESGVGRELAVLGELLERGGETPLERWLDAVDVAALTQSDPRSETPQRRSDLRQAFFALGASRLLHLERLDIPAGKHGLLAWAGRGIEIAALLDRWRAMDAPTLADHHRRFGELLADHLGWAAERPARILAMEAMGELDAPWDLDLEFDEFILALSPALERRRREPLGGGGGGVQVLSAMEAMGRTFEQLFLFAMVRGVFPRLKRDEALLPDRLRLDFVRLLPDLPIKAAGIDEERFLFAQLMSSASRVTVSSHQEGAQGRHTAPSPFLDELSAIIEARAPRLWAPLPQACRPVEEELLVRALHADRSTFADLLEPALVQARRMVGGTESVSGSALAHSRLAVLQELDPDLSTREGRLRSRRLGPYFGFVGTPRLAADPRRGDLWVTTLENLAACPWQTFLIRFLRVEPVGDPLAALPSLRGLLVGRVVHRVLERVARPGDDESLVGAAAVAWPSEDELEAALAIEAAAVLEEEGLRYAALTRAAMAQARPYLEVARQVDWHAAAPKVLRVETAEALDVADSVGGRRRLRFRADRVDAMDTPKGSVARLYTDYKTGSPRRRKRRAGDDLARLVRGGEWLQAAAYAARAGRDEEIVGRYVFLRPGLDDEDRTLAIHSTDSELLRGFADTVSTLLSAWDAGTFFPRLVEPADDVEPRRCRSCRVAEACLRRDSGARARLRRWAEEEGEAAVKGRLERAWRGVWDLRRLPAAEERAKDLGEEEETR